MTFTNQFCLAPRQEPKSNQQRQKRMHCSVIKNCVIWSFKFIVLGRGTASH